MPLGIGARVKDAFASLSKPGSDNDRSPSPSPRKSRGRSTHHSSYVSQRHYTEPITRKSGSSRSRSRSGHRTRRYNTDGVVTKCGKGDGEKKVGILGRMKADFMAGWDAKMGEEDERLEKKRLEKALEKERMRQRRGRRKVKAAREDRERRQDRAMEGRDQPRNLDDGMRELSLGNIRKREGNDYKEYLSQSKMNRHKTTLEPRGRRRSRDSSNSLGSESSGSTVGPGALGDMTRTFVDGMIMPEALREISRREQEKEEKRKEAEHR